MSNALKHLNLFITFAVRFKEANVKALAFFLHTYQSLKTAKKNLKKPTKKKNEKKTH